MNLLVLNAGSSSVKFALFNYGTEQALREGEISWSNGNRDHAHLVVHSPGGHQEFTMVAAGDDHAAANHAIQAALGPEREKSDNIMAVAHRIVHGGTQFRETVIIDDRVKNAISGLNKLAPLHNPPALKAIAAAEAAFPDVPQLAVFDTAFYENLEPKAFIYPLPYGFYKHWGIRRYGFHGISHAYCAERASELRGYSSVPLHLVICHLGGGCSATAVFGGTAVATTSGFSPLDGLMMGTRPGALDPGILLALHRQHGLTLDEIERSLNSSSGLMGVSGISPDLADIERAAERGDERARLAFDMFADRVRSAIGGLAVTLGKLDALVFTDRIGENSAALRASVCDGLELMGLHLDPDLNDDPHPDADIAKADSRGRIFVIHTREELMIAREATRLLSRNGVGPPDVKASNYDDRIEHTAIRLP